MRVKTIVLCVGLVLLCASLSFFVMTRSLIQASKPAPSVKPAVIIPPPTATSTSSVTTTAEVPLSDYWSQFPGALVKTTMTSRVGVLLDEIPQAERSALVENLLAKPAAYWKERAIKQIRFTTLRRNYGIKYGEKPLPLPPEELWQVELVGAPQRETVNNHDVVTIGYTYAATLLTDPESPKAAVAVLGEIGGSWSDQLILPLDPEFVFQRTGFACMNESESPPNSIDAEEADFYYDQKCRVEEKLSNINCHQTRMPTESCADAVANHIGAQNSTMTFERLAWDPVLAAQVRLGDITLKEAPDLKPIQSRFLEHRFTYRYIPANSCTLVEKCVGGSGWRQLMMFPTGDVNTGGKALNIGRVDYFNQTKGSLLSEHGVFEYSSCHKHYHFSHYGSFTLGNGQNGLNRKQAFCLQPTSRLMNNELSPLNHPYSNCIDQGVAVGWIDEYNMGLECQWLDVSKVKPQTLPISFTSNPDGMMCEGTLKFDDKGKQLFEPTKFKTAEGKSVDRPQCDFAPGWEANNTISYEVKVPPTGEGYITEACPVGLFGPLRNCGLKNTKKILTCDPGSTVKLKCRVPAKSASQVLRICEASKALKSGLPCTYSDSLATAIVPSFTEVMFMCPAARDAVETGGTYSFFTGALFPEQRAATVTCEIVEQTPAPTETTN